jgi:hypothetical protein
MKIKRFIIGLVFVLIPLAFIFFMDYSKEVSVVHKVGTKLDSLNGVYVYHNGKVSNVSGRHFTPDGYNLGLKYQCVEFVKRYYYEHLNHKMPNSYGHAKDFFNPAVPHGSLNKDRNLIQYCNNGKTLPKPDDLLIFGPTRWNTFGHVAIVSRVDRHELEYIQQNPGLMGNSRETIRISHRNQNSILKNGNLLGWLRKE